MRFATAVMLALLAGCQSVPDQSAPPPDAPPVVCTLPAGMTERQAEPVRPTGDYPQSVAAQYLTSLHQWGAEGWRRLDEADNYSRACEARHEQARD